MIQQLLPYLIEALAVVLIALLVGALAGLVWALLPLALYLIVVAEAIRVPRSKP